ncbi:TerB family tellurite resistance protein, partial [Oleiphilus sp. HI0043]|uniref:tellurite resistance TerB family protein n=2 Tax=Oleiphilus TaxID=141450 RepID=UPI000A42D8F0
EHTDLINKKFDSDSKYRLILAMWKIAYADSDIDRYEEHLIRKVSDLIYIPHTLFIKAKHEASNI